MGSAGMSGIPLSVFAFYFDVERFLFEVPYPSSPSHLGVMPGVLSRPQAFIRRMV
jgi:hypothetical protein